MLLASGAAVIFAPRMFLALIGLFCAFLFSGLFCLTLGAKFIAVSLFVLGCFILCPIIFILMKKINRWNLPLKIGSPLKLIVTGVVSAVFAFLAGLFVNEEFRSSLFAVFNLTLEKSEDVINFREYIFPLHIVIILALVAVVVVNAILRTTNTEEDSND